MMGWMDFLGDSLTFDRQTVAQGRLLHRGTGLSPDGQAHGADHGGNYRDGECPTHVKSKSTPLNYWEIKPLS